MHYYYPISPIKIALRIRSNLRFNIGHPERQVCQLLKRGADKSLKNVDGVTPLEIAIEGKHADIVTLKKKDFEEICVL
ncbi:hypothetical protein DICVIV_02581 [Dictyocaulus viviparus]|uniref:Uncharacterized protein n=1 Tax=Dictyocaulus viviparus TaxID=29172 RepID=A0A0D8Y9I3_DICVI|nr:hypothetical protein DICVIV_02581 [Dictyocaulus viviparus]